MKVAIILMAIATILNGITLILNCKALVNINEMFKHFRLHQIGFNKGTIRLFEEITGKKPKNEAVSVIPKQNPQPTTEATKADSTSNS